jgi:hypothetical protein
MSEVHIYRIGPINESGDCLYVPASSQRALEVEDARDDVAGIRKLVQQWPDATFRCSPDLAAAATTLGLEIAPLDAITEGRRIRTAIAIAEDPDFDGIPASWGFLRLMGGVQSFLEQGAIARWPAKLSIDIELRGSREARWAGSLLTAPWPGLVIFQEAADAKECSLLDADAQQGFLARRDHLRVQLEPAPEYVAVWLRDFYGIDRMPRLVKRVGEHVLADEEDALVLGGALSALSLVEDVRETMYSVTKSPGREVRTFVSPGAPWPFVHVPGT